MSPAKASLKGTSRSRKKKSRQGKTPPLIAIPSIDAMSEFGGALRELSAISSEIRSAKAGHRDEIRSVLVRAFAVASFLRNDSDAWLEFCRSEFWHGHRRPTTDQASEALRFVVRRVIGFGQNPRSKKLATKRASKWTAAAEPFFSRQDNPQEFGLSLSEKGVEALAREGAQSRRSNIAAGSDDGKKPLPKRFAMRGKLNVSNRKLFRYPAGSVVAIEVRFVGEPGSNREIEIVRFEASED